MKKVFVVVHDSFCCCTDCPLSKEIEGEDYCKHPKTVGKVTEYYNDQTGYHPQCPLPSLPESFDSFEYIEKLLTDSGNYK